MAASEMSERLRAALAPRPVLVAILLGSLWLAVPGAARAQAAPARAVREQLADFTDKWLINGSNIGGAVGAVLADLAVRPFAPGPLASVLATFVGNQIGQLAGEYVDNKIHKSYNYVAFNRPALGETGGMWLPDAGPFEQTCYQIDRWGISGGTIASLGTHHALATIGHAVPGGALLTAPLVMALADYIAGTIGDNVDGMIDLSQIGKRIDRSMGTPPAPGRDPAPTGHGGRIHAAAGARDSYSRLVDALKSGDQDAIRAAHQAYRRALTTGR